MPECFAQLSSEDNLLSNKNIEMDSQFFVPQIYSNQQLLIFT